MCVYHGNPWKKKEGHIHTMEVEEEEHALIKVKARLLPYIKTWHTMVLDVEEGRLTQTEYEVSDHPYYLKPALWESIFTALETHDQKQIALGEARFDAAIGEWQGIETLSLYDLYVMLHAAHMQDIPALEPFLCDVIIERLRALSTKELEEMHTARIVPFRPSNYKEEVALAYATWRDTVRQIVWHALGSMYLQDVLMSRLPVIGPLISVGLGHTMVITSEGLQVCGDRAVTRFGQLMSSTREPQTYFERIETGRTDNIVATSCGGHHSMVLTSEGLFSCGYNLSGQLGRGEGLHRSAVLKKVALEGVIAVSCGGDHTMILTNHGLYGCGCNMYNQLGLGRTIDKSYKPVKMPDFPYKIIAVSCGRNFTMILTTEGLFSVGANYGGEQGINTYEGVARPQRVLLPSDVQVVSVACGGYHALMLLSDGRVFGCGNNMQGQLVSHNTAGVRLSYSKPVEISFTQTKVVKSIGAGGHHSLFHCVEADEIIIVGEFRHGQLGVNHRGNTEGMTGRFKGVLEYALGYDSTIVLFKDGAQAFGVNWYTEFGRSEEPQRLLVRMGHEAPDFPVIPNNKNKAEDEASSDRPDKRQRTTLTCTVCTKEATMVSSLRRHLLFCSKSCHTHLLNFRVPSTH